MPEVRPDATDAAELAEMLQFLVGWLDRDPAGWPPRWHSSSATPPTASANCVTTWPVSPSCSAGTKNLSSARSGNHRHARKSRRS
jgi:hypothetical protein